MSREWFPDLAPPPGGLERLRARLDRRRRPLARPLVGLALAAAALLLWLRLPPSHPTPAAPLGPGIAVLTGLPAEPVTVAPGETGGTAVTRVPTEDRGVVMYRVASTTAAQRESVPQ